MNLLSLALATFLALAFSPLDTRAAEENPQSLQKKCDAKDWNACDQLGNKYEFGENVAKDVAKAGALYERACNGGFGQSCTGLGLLHNGDALPKDAAKSMGLYTRACELKDGFGCYQLGLYYLNGEDVPKDLGRAIRLIDQGCDLKDGDACYELYTVFSSGDAVPKDQAKADAYYERSCDLYATWCVMAFNEVLRPLTAACEKGNVNACHTIGSAHLNGESYLRPDEATATPLLLKACDGGIAAACADLGWIYDNGKQTPRNRSKAAGFYQKACTGKNAYGCQMLGILYLIGDGVAKDERKAADLLRTACNENMEDVASACGLLAESYLAGSGVAKDPGRAASLHAQACRLGLKESCAFKPEAGSMGPRPKPAAAGAPAATTPAAAGCSVAKVRLGSDTVASVQRDIARRGGNPASGTNNGKLTLNALSGDYSDSGAGVMAVNYTFDADRPTGRLIGVTIVNHANSKADFEKLLAARKTASAGVAGPNCSMRLVPNADTFFIYELYELK